MVAHPLHDGDTKGHIQGHDQGQGHLIPGMADRPMTTGGGTAKTVEGGFTTFWCLLWGDHNILGTFYWGGGHKINFNIKTLCGIAAFLPIFTTPGLLAGY